MGVVWKGELKKTRSLVLNSVRPNKKISVSGIKNLGRLGTYYYPHAFLKKRWGYCNRLRPSVRLSVRLSVRPSVTLSPPKPLDEIQPNLVCVLLT